MRPSCAGCGCNWSMRTKDCATCANRHKQRSTALMFSNMLHRGGASYTLVAREPVVVSAPWDAA